MPANPFTLILKLAKVDIAWRNSATPALGMSLLMIHGGAGGLLSCPTAEAQIAGRSCHQLMGCGPRS